jgi:putative transposase
MMAELSRSLPSLSARDRDRALWRFELLRPYLEHGVPLSRIARDQGVAPRTLERWVARYRAEGLTGLARHPRVERGKHQLPEKLQLLIEGLALERPRRSVASIRRKACEVAEREGWRQPGYKLVWSIVRHLDPALLTLAHEGEKAYRQAYDLIHRREASRPNEIWQADHTELDIRVLDDRGESVRPWLTAVLDDYSRAVAGYYLTFAAPSAIGTALALHQAVWRKEDPRWQVCGIPDTFYTDHGPDFTSRHLEAVAADLGMALVFSEAGQPRGRGKMERFFGTVNQLLLSDLPGYAPDGSRDVRSVLTLAELDARFRAWLLDEYHARMHGETKQTPAGRWAVGAFLPRMPDSLEELDLLLLTVARARKVHPDEIRFGGRRYIDTTLAAYVGEEVAIRYDPRDVGEVRVFHEGSFLCRAVCPKLAGETVSLREIVSARNRRRRELRTELRERQAVVEELLALRRREPPAEETRSEPLPPPSQKPRLKRYVHE